MMRPFLRTLTDLVFPVLLQQGKCVTILPRTPEGACDRISKWILECSRTVVCLYNPSVTNVSDLVDRIHDCVLQRDPQLIVFTKQDETFDCILSTDGRYARGRVVRFLPFFQYDSTDCTDFDIVCAYALPPLHDALWCRIAEEPNLPPADERLTDMMHNVCVQAIDVPRVDEQEKKAQLGSLYWETPRRECIVVSEAK